MNIFIDTEDMEERYGEELYKDYLEEQNKQLKEDYQVLRTTNISLNDLVNSCQKEIRNLKQERDKYKSIVEMVKDYIKEKARNNCWIDQYEASDLLKKIKELEEGNSNE